MMSRVSISFKVTPSCTRAMTFTASALSEDAVRTEGFTCVELMATMAGEPLYRACGYDTIEKVVDERGGVGVPLSAVPLPLLAPERGLARAQRGRELPR